MNNKFIFNKLSFSVAVAILLCSCSVEPQPFDKEDKIESAKSELALVEDTEKVTKPINLEEAIERGTKYNRQKRIKIMESALAQRQFDLSSYDMLPSLTANAGYTQRNNYAASASTVFEDGKPAPFDPSTSTYSLSQDKSQVSSDITFSWNVLDFGLSYVRAQQQADRYLISKEQERKVIHNITQDIRRAYYQAVTAEELLKKIHPLMEEARGALQNSNKIRELRVKSPMEALIYQKELLEVLKELRALEKSLMSSKIELAELMGLKPDTPFELADKIQDDYEVPRLTLQMPMMYKLALENRPEIIESRYKERISEKEIDTVLLKVLPGISLDAGYNYTDNNYALNNDWYSVGTRVSWNLFNVFKYDAMKDEAQTKNLVAKEQKLALALAVITQVHIANITFQQSISEYKLSNEYLKVSKEIYNQTMNQSKLNMTSDLVIIKEKLSYLLATLRHSASYAEMQNSYGRIFASIGIKYEPVDKIKTQPPIVVQTTQQIKITQEPKQEAPKIAEAPKTVETPKVSEAPQVAQPATDKMNETDISRPILDIVLLQGDVLSVAKQRYVVKHGDTSFRIAKKYDVRLIDIVKENTWLIKQKRVIVR